MADQGSSVTGRSSTNTQPTVVHESSVFGGGDQDSGQPYLETWQPIATAPKDGSRVMLMRLRNPKFDNLPEILWIKVGRWSADYRDHYRQTWREDAIGTGIDTRAIRLVPSHWTPMPLPPATDASVPDAGAVTDGPTGGR